MQQRWGRKLTKFVTFPYKNKLYLPHCYLDKGLKGTVVTRADLLIEISVKGSVREK